MWSPSEVLGSLEGDWEPAFLFPETDIYENANKDIFTSDEEEGVKSPLVSEISKTLTVNEEKECWRRYKEPERTGQLKKRAIATISVMKTPKGWKPPITYIKVEKPLTKSSCCVLSCSNSPQRCAGHIKFHSFPGKAYEKERKEMWITAINRINKITTKRNKRVIIEKEAQENHTGRKIVCESPNGFEGD